MEDNVPAGVGIANVVEDTTPQLGGNLDTNSKQIRESKGADVASASALPVLADGNYFDVTGTNAITSINAIAVGTTIKLHFDAALILTHNATDLILPGAANITTAAGDEAMFVEYATGDWRCVAYTKANGEAVVSGGAVNYASRTAVGAADYNPAALTTDHIIAFTNTAAARACIISTEDRDSGSTSTPRIFIIKDESGGAATNNITISLETAGTIDGVATAVLSGNYDSITLYIDGTNGHII